MKLLKVGGNLMKKLNKILAVMLSLIIVAGFATVTTSANTTETTTQNLSINETEPNNYFTTANELKENEDVSGEIAGEDRYDVYKFTIEKRSRVTLYHRGTVIEFPHKGIEYTIYKENYTRYTPPYYYRARYNDDLDPNDLSSIDSKNWQEDSDSFVLNKGTYYFVIHSNLFDNEGQYKIMYNTSDTEPVFKNVYYGHFNVQFVDIYAGSKEVFKIIDGKAVKWDVENDKIIKIDLVDDKVRIFGLQKGYSDVIATLDNGEKIKMKVDVVSSPRLTLPGKTKTIKSVTVKKGKTVTVRIQDKQSKIKNTYTNSKHAKIISKRNAYDIKIKGKKVGTSYVKIKVNGVKTLKLKVKVVKDK